MEERTHIDIDFGKPVDMTKNIIKVVGVGGGGCNAVKSMYETGITDVTFAALNTDSKSLAHSPVPVKVMLGDVGLGVGGVPEKGRDEAENSIERIKTLFSDDTKMVFVTAGMGGGTGTGAAPVVAGVAKSMGLLTIGIVTIPFYFEKKKKIIKALKGVDEMRKNVDSLLIINNERLCDIYSDSRVTVKEAFKRADDILCNAVRSISELITIEGDINLDFCDVESTMKSGGGAIMAIGRAGGEHRVEKAIINALDSPLLYGSDILKAKRILFNIYTSEEAPLFVDEMAEIDAFMDELSSDIEVIWGVSDDNSLGEDAKIAILATGMDSDGRDFVPAQSSSGDMDEEHYINLIGKLYKPMRPKDTAEQEQEMPVMTVNDGQETVAEVPLDDEPADSQAETPEETAPDETPSDTGTDLGKPAEEEQNVSAQPENVKPEEPAQARPAQPEAHGKTTLVARLRQRLGQYVDGLLREP